MGDGRQLVERYLEVWNEEDPALRRAGIEEVWCEDGIYIDPEVAVAGRAALDATVAAVREQHPALVFTLTGEVDVRPRLALFCWQHGVAGGAEPLAVGFVLAVLTDEGDRMRSVHVFMDEPYPEPLARAGV
ncbi:hypothetical protein SRB5_47550 [Streptomyces sp. RB5]|uniref:SnoaL-like domain-containing protein n=1 Tax=Streptomyces smaragdinus TaxID=2585196 RepID=A0A7K0CM92_9ACTN|nr:nuclear transport factor 2 family protein [Streptomyces smaragdinus]MQY14587.1 hypothetical protein [Streptomyces smaragdinus]